MTDADLFPFMAIFTMMTKVFPFRADGDEARDISRAYFKTLKSFPLDLVKIGADNCIAGMEKFPKPAEWKKHIPRRMPGAELQRLTAAEESAWRHAEQLGYEGGCCTCAECVAIGAHTLPTRFVPLEPEEPAMMGDRAILRGEWIHAEPLVRWHLAREEFWSKFSASRFGKDIVAPKMLKKLSAQERIEAVFSNKTPRKEWTPYAEREPGSEG